MTGDRDNWRPTASWEMLRRRAALLAQLRTFFARHGFLEVETPLLSADTVVDRHLDPFGVPISGPPAATNPQYWLQTSPEFAMKRLMAAGGEAIYQVTRAFRRDEQGQRHNPEFTIVEWYRVGDSLDAGMQFLSELCQEMLGTPPAVQLTYQAAFQQHVGIDPHTATNEEIVEAARHHGVSAPESLGTADRDAWLDLLLVTLIEPHLGKVAPTILHDYPPSQAALAIVRPGPPPVAERFELYVRGIELANGYHELLDPHALGARNRENNRARVADGKRPLPEESRLLAAMETGLPACCGVALGFDRVVMLATGASSIDEVIAFPFDRA
ncbi:MAG TPA: EF-P lysine aminoacylase EpmA [Pirellulales bacterium]|nr:EF-P lysine aminoacylase EpmA [Pirellulales bacterium]